MAMLCILGLTYSFGLNLRKTIPILSLFVWNLFSSQCLASQNDSLVNIIRFERNDSLVMDAKAKLSYSVYKFDQDSAIKLMTEALSDAQNLNLDFNKAQYLRSLGVYYYQISSYNLALEYLKEASDLYTRLQDKVKLADTQFYTGLCYHEMSNYNTAIDYCYKSLQLYEELKDTIGIARTLNNIGVSLEAMDEFESASKLYQRSFQFKKFANDYNGMANAYMNLGNVKLRMGDIDSSLYYHKLSLQAANLLRDKRLMINALVCLGNDYHEKKNYSKAIEKFEFALAQFGNYRNGYQLSDVYNGLAKAYHEAGEIDKALACLKYNTKQLKDLGAGELLKNTYLLYAEINADNGQYGEAYEAMKEYAFLKDSIYNSEKLSSIVEMQEKYKADKRLKEIESLKHRNELSEIKTEKQQFILKILIGFSFVVTVLLIAMLIIYKQRKKTNKLLRRSVEEKEVLIKEVHHRVKNNFQLISSLLNLQSDLIVDEKALMAISEGRNRIESMALVHKYLYMTEDLRQIEMQLYVDQLIKSIISSFDSTETKITHQVEAEGVSFDVDTSVPIGLLINELVTNSVKYAFVGKETGKIKVIIRELDNDKYELIYSDDGVGIPDDIDLDNLNSLGLELVQLLAAQLNGTMTYYVNNGTIFKVKFTKA